MVSFWSGIAAYSSRIVPKCSAACVSVYFWDRQRSRELKNLFRSVPSCEYLRLLHRYALSSARKKDHQSKFMFRKKRFSVDYDRSKTPLERLIVDLLIAPKPEPSTNAYVNIHISDIMRLCFGASPSESSQKPAYSLHARWIFLRVLQN